MGWSRAANAQEWRGARLLAVQRRDGVCGTKRVSPEVVAELFDGIVRAWVSSRNMKISASIVVLLGSLTLATSARGEISVRPIGPLMHHIALRSHQRVTSVTATAIFDVGQVATRQNEVIAPFTAAQKKFCMPVNLPAFGRVPSLM